MQSWRRERFEFWVGGILVAGIAWGMEKGMETTEVMVVFLLYLLLTNNLAGTYVLSRLLPPLIYLITRLGHLYKPSINIIYKIKKNKIFFF